MAAPMTVTATQGGTTANGILLRVKVLTGTAGSPVGNSGTFTSGTTGPAQCTVTTTQAGSMVYGALMAFPTGAGLTAHAGTTLLDSHDDTTNANYYGTFQTTAVTGTPGATVVGTDSPAASGGYSLAAQEILSAGTIQDDPSAPAPAETDSGTVVTTASFSPPDGALLLALVGSDGNTGTTTMTVSGGGVTWTELVKGQDSTDGGYAGVWVAVAGTTAPDDPLITVTETGSTSQGVTARIKVLTGAAPAAAQTGATAVQSATGAHQASVTTTQAGSIVYGALIDGNNNSFTADASTTLFDNIADVANTIRYGTCRTTAATGTPGAVTVGTSSPSTDVGGCALAEILPVVPGGTINEDVSSPAVVTVTGSITAQVNVLPPPGSLLVLMAASDGSTGVTTMTVSGGGLTWRALSEAHATGQQYAGVWVADAPVTVPPPPPRPGRTWLRRFRHPQQVQQAPAATGAVAATASGTLDISGTGAAAAPAAAAGALSVSGAGTGQAPVTAAGTLALAGTAGAAAPAPAAASITFAGSAAGQAPAAAAASVTLAGTASAQAPAAAHGALVLTGTASAAAPAAAAGSITFAATATATGPGSTGAGSVAVTGTASAAAPAGVTGSITFSGTVTAQAPAAASGTATFAGTAAAQAPAPAAGTLVMSGAASARAPAAAAASITFAAAGTAQAPAAAAASVTFAGTASATGPGSTGAGALAVTGTASARAPASAAGSLVLSGAAAPSAPASAAGSITLAATAAASGPPPPFTVGTLTASSASSALTAAQSSSALTAATAAQGTLTASAQTTGGPS